MSFVQTIEFHTTKVDELLEFEEQWRKATEGKRTLRRSIIARDRNDPNRYFVFAFFDSYESAMENSKLPETSEFAEKQAALTDAPMVFADLDVIEERD
jgi:hypothetical protein